MAPLTRCAICATTAVVALACASIASAQAWPAKPIRVVVPFSPGTPIEVPARAVTRRMTETFGQSFVFDYRTGASGTIGTEAVARAPKDGYTMLITNCSHSANPSYYRKLPYDTENDFAPVSQINVTYGNLLVVHPSVPARSVKEFIALAKARPGDIKYASAGIGSPPHVSAALFAAMSGIKLLHVPYKGTAIAFNDLLGGHIDAEVARAVALPETKKYLADNGLIPTGSSPEEFAEFIRKDILRQADIVKQIGLQPQ